MKEVIEHMQSEFENILLDTQKEYRRSNRMKDKIIVVLIVLMFLEAIIGYCGFVWYESQFDYVTTEQTMLSEEEKKILWLHYKEQKTMAFIADELGMSEVTVKKKHSKMLMKIGKMF
jgi:hypothetical protein